MTGTACHMRTIRGRCKTVLRGPASGITKEFLNYNSFASLLNVVIMIKVITLEYIYENRFGARS